MAIPEYRDKGALDVVAHIDFSQLVGKSVIVTGGTHIFTNMESIAY